MPYILQLHNWSYMALHTVREKHIFVMCKLRDRQYLFQMFGCAQRMKDIALPHINFQLIEDDSSRIKFVTVSEARSTVTVLRQPAGVSLTRQHLAILVDMASSLLMPVSQVQV